jgi:hypothetical protein
METAPKPCGAEIMYACGRGCGNMMRVGLGMG